MLAEKESLRFLPNRLISNSLKFSGHTGQHGNGAHDSVSLECNKDLALTSFPATEQSPKTFHAIEGLQRGTENSEVVFKSDEQRIAIEAVWKGQNDLAREEGIRLYLYNSGICPSLAKRFL